jgi:hypothetical protein
MKGHHVPTEMKMKEPPHVRRARGGGIKGGSKEFVEEGAGEGDGEGEKLAAPGRRAGGKVKGKKSMKRPDKRARGGATSDENPLTSAGKVSKEDYEAKQAPADEHGKGTDSEK